MHNSSGPAPDFIPLTSSSATNEDNSNSTNTDSSSAVRPSTLPRTQRSSRGRGGHLSNSHRGRYGPPSLPRGLANSAQSQVRTKRKREPTSGESAEEQSNLHLEDVVQRMPWHPSGLSRYSPGIIG